MELMTDREKFENTKTLLTEIYKELTYVKSYGREWCADGLALIEAKVKEAIDQTRCYDDSK
jgi:hypothetical protein